MIMSYHIVNVDKDRKKGLHFYTFLHCFNVNYVTIHCAVFFNFEKCIAKLIYFYMIISIIRDIIFLLLKKKWLKNFLKRHIHIHILMY